LETDSYVFLFKKDAKSTTLGFHEEDFCLKTLYYRLRANFINH